MPFTVVSTRGPFSHERTGGAYRIRYSAGGVSSSISRLMDHEGGTWVCLGDGSGDQAFEVEDHGNYRISRVIIGKKETKGFYEGYANSTLWPLFHYFRERVNYNQTNFMYYEIVNKLFAETVKRNIDVNTTIWVHDYQLALLPGMLRNDGIKNRIIFSWHIPWVSPEFFSLLPESRQLIQGIARADAITVHTDWYKTNFVNSYRFVTDSDDSIESRVFDIPLGIDNRYYASKAKHAHYPLDRKDRKLIFSVDRLDYTKGLVNRVLAVEKLLILYPYLAEKFVYVMAVNPSRASVRQYQIFRRELEFQIGRINGEYGNVNWMPIVYMYKRLGESSLISFYRHADVALVTPLSDGLNLVSKEFVACTNDGVLVLSKFAGAAQDLKGAVIVNPNSLEEMANAIRLALTMDADERAQRLTSMKGNVERRNLTWWLNRVRSLAARKLHENAS